MQICGDLAEHSPDNVGRGPLGHHLDLLADHGVVRLGLVEQLRSEARQNLEQRLDALVCVVEGVERLAAPLDVRLEEDRAEELASAPILASEDALVLDPLEASILEGTRQHGASNILVVQCEAPSTPHPQHSRSVGCLAAGLALAHLGAPRFLGDVREALVLQVGKLALLPEELGNSLEELVVLLEQGDDLAVLGHLRARGLGHRHGEAEARKLGRLENSESSNRSSHNGRGREQENCSLRWRHPRKRARSARDILEQISRFASDILDKSPALLGTSSYTCFA